jgi:uncharacterized protein YndB with AHSA1/START domain
MTGTAFLEVERRLPAPIAEVFRWWTEPELLSRWMTPTGTVEVSLELRVGGALRIVMRGSDTVIEHAGTYIEIDPPRRLVFTWASPFTGAEPSLVTVDLEPDGDDATILRLRHSELPDAVAESHRGGWSAMLDRLATGLEEG